MKTTFTSAFLIPLCFSLPALADKDDHLRPPDHLPVPLVVQAPEELAFASTGVGVQIYDCRASGGGFAWVFPCPRGHPAQG